MSSAVCFDLYQYKILSSGNGLREFLEVDHLFHSWHWYTASTLLTLSQTAIFRTGLNWNEFADDNIKLNENGRKFSRLVKNTVGKGEIARYEQFLLFSQCFQ